MHSLCVRYTTVLILVLSQALASSEAGDAIHQHIFPAKVFSGPLGTPLISLNNSWTLDEVRSRCRNDVVTLLESVETGELWALKMLDAASRLPSGILENNMFGFGMYDECINVKGDDNPAGIHGQYCLVSLSIPTKFFKNAKKMLFVQKISFFNPSGGDHLSLTLSVCLPSTCDVNDIGSLVSASIQNTSGLAEFEVNVARVRCSSNESAGGSTLGSMLTKYFFGVTIGVLLFCTLCDFAVRKIPFNSCQTLIKLAKFSLYTNAMKLLSTKAQPESMPAMNGLRVFHTCLIIAIHRLGLAVVKPMANFSDFLEFRHSIWASVSFSLTLAVDTFFIFGGFLAAHAFLKAVRSGQKFNVFTSYIQRYLRLTPCLAAIMLFGMFIYPDLGSGPIWDPVMSTEIGFCRKNWWTNLLYISNFFNGYEICLPHTWYLAADMQLFWICPIILYPLYHKQKLGLIILGLLSIASLIVPAVQIAVHQWAALISLQTANIQQALEQWGKFYPIAYNRALPYFIGIWLGYDIVNNERRVTKTQVRFNWIMTCVPFVLSAWITPNIQPIARTYNLIWEVAYISVLRLGWCLSMAWIVYACTQGYGGVVAKLFSLPIFVPLNRLCYCVYLIHPFIQMWTIATVKNVTYFSHLNEIYQIPSDIILSVAFAIVLSLCFETPVMILTKPSMTDKRPPLVDKPHIPAQSTQGKKELDDNKKTI